MPLRTLRRIVPSLLALGLLPAAAGAAVGPVERDAHFAAVVGLIERDCRLPAQAQIADFRAAAYPEAAWHGRFLAWYHADRFRLLAADPAERARLAERAAALERELQAALRAGELPPELVARLSGGGRVLRLVNDLLRCIGCDQPSDPLRCDEAQRDAAGAMIRALAEAGTAAWEADLARIRANAGNEQEWIGIQDTRDPRYERLARQAVELRFTAVRTAWFAVRALREAAERGGELALDAGPAAAFLREFATRNHALLQEWDFVFGDFHPGLRALALDLAAQAARYRVRGADPGDLAADLRQFLDLEVGREWAHAPAVAEELRTLQARAWAGHLAWCRELGREVSPRWYEAGVQAWNEFRERSRGDRHLRLDHPDAERAAEVARVHLQAGRLLLARDAHDPAAAAAFAAVAGVRGNPLARCAADWLAALDRRTPPPPAQAWGAQPVAEEPARALQVADAMRRRAEASGDPARQREALLAGAVALRGGVLGLSATPADALAPQLWFRYAECLSRLGMGWQAAVVAQAGLRHLAARQQALQGRTPWRQADGAWTEDGRYVSLLARNAVAYACNLMAAGRGGAATRLYDEAVGLLGQLSPGDGGRRLDGDLIRWLAAEGEFERALALSEAFARKYPEADAEAAGLRQAVFSAWLASRLEPAQRQAVAARARSACAADARWAGEALAGARDPARRQEIERVQRGGRALAVAVALSTGEHEAVLAQLGGDYWRAEPERDEAAQMLGHLCTALQRWYEARTADPAARADPALLLAAWPRIQEVHGIWRGQAGAAARADRNGRQIAWVCDLIANVQVPAMRRQPDAPPELAAIGAAAGRIFADLVEPELGAGSPTAALDQVGEVLWELGERVRAGRLLQLGLERRDADPALAALRDAPAEVLRPLDALIRPRPELRTRWEEVVDLLQDQPQLKDAIEAGLPEAEWRERKRDWLAATAAIGALRREVAAARLLLGGAGATIDAGLAGLEQQVRELDRTVVIIGRLAEVRRAQGDLAGARALYDRLLAYDPGDLAAAAASTELTIAAYRDGPAAVPAAALAAARAQAVRVRALAPACSPEYWTAAIQVHELSVALKDLRPVDDRLRFDPIAGSTPDDDLQVRPRPRQDDPRVRRLRDAPAAALCRRYLALFAQPGITARPRFALVELVLDGRPAPVCVPAGGPAFAVQRVRLPDGGEVEAVLPTGQSRELPATSGP